MGHNSGGRTRASASSLLSITSEGLRRIDDSGAPLGRFCAQALRLFATADGAVAFVMPALIVTAGK